MPSLPPPHGVDVAPRLREGVDVRALPLQVEEAYLLSRVDGVTSAAQLADVVGFDLSRVLAALARLEELGALYWLGTSSLSTCELTAEERSEIERAEQLYERASHWVVLGLTGAPGPAEIKRAYYSVSKRFHPDRYFGRALGPYNARVEALFKRAKLAYDVLSDAVQRASYAKATPPPKAPAGPAARSDPAPSVEDEATRERRLEARRQEILAARRQVRRPVHKVTQAAIEQGRAHYTRALGELQAGNASGALRSLRLALSFDPDNAEYKARCDALAGDAASASARALAEQARAMEQTGSASEAAELYAQASDLNVKHTGFATRAAELLLSVREKERAWVYAQRALASGPKRVEVQLLAAACLEAKGALDAALEHARAAGALDQNDARVKSVLARLEKKR